MRQLEARPRLYQEAADIIRQHIIAQHLQPGDPLPSEREFQAQLGMSRHSVREALRTLASMGLVETVHGKGLFVRQFDPRPMVDAVVSHMELIDSEAFGHLLDVRQALELGAANLAAKRRTADDVAALAANLAATRETIVRGQSALADDLRFHELLVRSAHSPLFEPLYASIGAFLVEVRHRVPAQLYDWSITLEDHARIYQTVRDRDAHGAVMAVREHMLKTRINLGLPVVDDEPGPGTRGSA